MRGVLQNIYGDYAIPQRVLECITTPHEIGIHPTGFGLQDPYRRMRGVFQEFYYDPVSSKKVLREV